MKIVIIGFSGSGKSTLALQLSEIFNLPVLHLDSTHFYDDWKERSKDEQEALVNDFILSHTDWIIEGNYLSIARERFQMSDMTIFLDLNRFVCFLSAYKRYKKYKGQCRPDLPCTEKFDKKFKKWLLIDGRTKERRLRILQHLNKTAGKKIILKSRRQIKSFINSLKSL